VEDHTLGQSSLEVLEGQHIPGLGELEELELAVQIQVEVVDNG
jgi:hypothetical protein